jgi:uncharacterized membrane protein YfcA
MFDMDIYGISFGVVLFLLVGSFVAGFVDSICGGGGLISVPVLLLAGFSPAQSIAANKLQGAVGALASTHYYASKNVFDRRELMWLLPMALIGGAIGGVVVDFVDSGIMQKVLPLLLAAMAIYFAFSQAISNESRVKKVSLALLSLVIFAIGLYDGFFGPGAGSFYLTAVAALFGMNVVKGMAYSRVLNLASNLSSLVVFIVLGKMVWAAGIAMSIGEAGGVYAGSHLVYKRGEKLVKPFLVVACLLMAIKLFVG